MFKTRLIAVILVMILFNINVYAVDSSSFWKEDGLKWSDFLSSPNKISTLSSELSYELGYESKKTYMNDLDIIYYEVYSKINKKLSWYKPESKTEILLMYNQTIINILELNRRKTQAALNYNEKRRSSEIIFNEFVKNLNIQIENFRKQTNDGQNEKLIDYWYHKTNKDLQDFENYKLPSFKYSKFGYGFDFGFGYDKRLGDFGDHFTDFLSINMGLDLKYSKSLFWINTSLSSGEVEKQILSGNTFWKKGVTISFTSLNLNYGYIISNNKHKLTPFIGLKFGLIDNFKEDDNTNQKLNANSRSITFGLTHDYCFNKKLDMRELFLASNKRYEQSWSFRSILSISPNNYFSSAKGYTINFSIGVRGFTNLVNLYK